MGNYLIGMKIKNEVKLIHSINAPTKEAAKKRYDYAFHYALRPNERVNENVIVIGEYKDGFLDLESDIEINKRDEILLSNSIHPLPEKKYENVKNETESNDFYTSFFVNPVNIGRMPGEMLKEESLGILWLIYGYHGTYSKDMIAPLIVRADSHTEARRKYIESGVCVRQYPIAIEKLHLFYIEPATQMPESYRGYTLVYDTINMFILSKAQKNIYCEMGLNKREQAYAKHFAFRNVIMFSDWDDSLKEKIKKDYPKWRGGEYEF